MFAQARLLTGLITIIVVVSFSGCSRSDVDSTPAKVTNIPKVENFPTPVPLKPGQLVPTGDENLTKTIPSNSGGSISQANQP